MINPVTAIHEIMQSGQGAGGAPVHNSAAMVGGASSTLVQADVVLLSQQALDGLLKDGLTQASNAGAIDAGASGAGAGAGTGVGAGAGAGAGAGVEPPVPSSLVNQIEAAAQSVAANPDFFSYLVNALGGSQYVAALMGLQQGGAPVEPVPSPVPPVGGVPSRNDLSKL
ncbi:MULTISPECIES: hypothetical protein [Acidiphilium]|uniref:Uncharacterized protein n=1 Tax=Acidiphilium rubrum TaxID=526 RepID=A0A8G2CK24_ACIRU|nr:MULTISPECIES: hypothetical protein [Acidiphilium]SIQ65322.1 hypothetical protein SAMN05421828_107119 [Acidiphilium rubrum]